MPATIEISIKLIVCGYFEHYDIITNIVILCIFTMENVRAGGGGGGGADAGAAGDVCVAAAVARRRGLPRMGRIAPDEVVKYWSNTGQTLIKHWSNTGQIVSWSNNGLRAATAVARLAGSPNGVPAFNQHLTSI